MKLKRITINGGVQDITMFFEGEGVECIIEKFSGIHVFGGPIRPNGRDVFILTAVSGGVVADTALRKSSDAEIERIINTREEGDLFRGRRGSVV